MLNFRKKADSSGEVYPKKGEFSMELLGFQFGNANHHPFVCWTRAERAKQTETARLEKYRIDPRELPEEESDVFLILSALSL